MRWEDLEQSSNIEDRRGEQGGGYGGGGFGMPIGGGGLGIGAIAVLGVIGWALGIDPRLLIGGAEVLSRGGGYEQQSRPAPGQRQARRTGTPNDQMGDFVSRILGNTEVVWKDVFSKTGGTYRPPILVLYNNITDGRCGGEAKASMGPFYCPNDRKVYLDTSFFRQIETRFHGCEGKACKFAQAYVIAHEVGHHVQNELGILPTVQRQQRGLDRTQANQLQVQVELQADCYAGVWANRENQRLKERGQPPFIEQSDVDAALKTASAIGDDTLQRNAGRAVVPDAFTHGSSEQRQRWFSTGFRQGTVGACDTFKAARL
jgi:predicted metalloprotease